LLLSNSQKNNLIKILFVKLYNNNYFNICLFLFYSFVYYLFEIESLYIEVEERENKVDKNNRIELQKISLLYIQKRDNNSSIYAFLLLL